MLVALKGESQGTAIFSQCAHADQPYLRTAHLEIAEAVGDIIGAECEDERQVPGMSAGIRRLVPGARAAKMLAPERPERPFVT